MNNALTASVFSVLLIAACSDNTAEETDPRPDRAAENRAAKLYLSEMASCLEEEGWIVTVARDGYSYTVEPAIDHPDGDAQVAEATRRCEQLISVPAPSAAPITKEEASALYDSELEAKDCLEEHGIEVSDPPSREVYIASYLAMEAPWSAHQNVLDPAALEQCPQPGYPTE